MAPADLIALISYAKAQHDKWMNDYLYNQSREISQMIDMWADRMLDVEVALEQYYKELKRG